MYFIALIVNLVFIYILYILLYYNINVIIYILSRVSKTCNNNDVILFLIVIIINLFSNRRA